MCYICLLREGAVDVGGLSGLDDSISSLPYRHRGRAPTPVGLLPMIAAPATMTRTSRTNLPSTVCHLIILGDVIASACLVASLCCFEFQLANQLQWLSLS